MNVAINRLDPNVPDPVESRRRAAGRLVRIAYATIVFGILGFFVVYFGAPLVFLGGPGIVSSPRHVVSLPYTVKVSHMNLAPGAIVEAGEEIGQVISPEQDSIVATYMRALADIAGRTAELRIRARVAQESLEAAHAYLRVTEEAVKRIDAASTGTVTFRMDVLRERASASKAVVSQEAEVAESATQLASLDEFIKTLRAASMKWRASSARAGFLRRSPESSRPASRMPASRWWRARRSPRSSIRRISSWTGTFPTRA